MLSALIRFLVRLASNFVSKENANAWEAGLLLIFRMLFINNKNKK
jgi:hypothetical protein